MKKIVLCLLLTGCTLTHEQSTSDLESLKNDLTYFKDYYDICYAALASVTNGVTVVTSITTIPCEKVGL